MWEAIRSNRRKSWLLVGLLGALLVCLGAAIGWAAIGDPGIGGSAGALGALALWLVLMLIAFFGGDRLLLSSAHARRIAKEDMPRLWNVVEEMTIASGLGKMPSVHLIDDPSPNAFAVGRQAETASVAVTTGLLKRLNRDELQGVVAHEVGHIKNLDVRFMTIASVTVGSIAVISEVFLRSLYYGGGRRRSRSSSRGGGQAQAVILLGVILLAVLAPVAARLLYLACSRRREYLADASAARFTRYPKGLASALEKISHKAKPPKHTNRAVAPLYIVNPLQARAPGGFFSTHPPTDDRIRILRSMGGGAGFAAYETAYRNVHGKNQHCLSDGTLSGQKDVPVRPPTVEAEPEQETLEQAREALDYLDRLADFLLIPCVCGLRIKIPPGFQQAMIACPRCGRRHDVPKALEIAPTDAPKESGQPAAGPITRYVRKGKGWESFKCSCGHAIHLSPQFGGTRAKCPECGRHIDVAPPGSS